MLIFLRWIRGAEGGEGQRVLVNFEPKTALDVEESAIEVLYAHIDDDMFIEF